MEKVEIFKGSTLKEALDFVQKLRKVFPLTEFDAVVDFSSADPEEIFFADDDRVRHEKETSQDRKSTRLNSSHR